MKEIRLDIYVMVFLLGLAIGFWWGLSYAEKEITRLEGNVRQLQLDKNRMEIERR